ncbi:MAG: UDP-2,3-diacylglucosamine diphosphatase [Candidatus Abyssubacteria bacterium]
MREKKVFFVSDAHLGSGTNEQRKEEILLDFLRGLSPERVSALYVLGDLFDFWFEYRTVIPSCHFRVLGALADTVRSGIEAHLIVGNHDFWAGEFLEKTVGIIVHKDPIEIELGGKRVYICHGDGLNPMDRGYLLLKAVIRSGPVIWLTRLIHPDFLVWLARRFSKLSRESVSVAGQLREDDGITEFAVRKLREGYDIVIAGHSHQPHEDTHSVDGAARRYFNVGDMQERFSYLEYSDGKFQLKYLVNSGPRGI